MGPRGEYMTCQPGYHLDVWNVSRSEPVLHGVNEPDCTRSPIKRDQANIECNRKRSVG